jgi:hypothetical protein
MDTIMAIEKITAAALRNKELARLVVEQELDDKMNITPAHMANECECVSIDECQDLEECSMKQQPLFGNTDMGMIDDMQDNEVNGRIRGCIDGGVQEYVAWFYDGEDSRWETN